MRFHPHRKLCFHFVRHRFWRKTHKKGKKSEVAVGGFCGRTSLTRISANLGIFGKGGVKGRAGPNSKETTRSQFYITEDFQGGLYRGRRKLTDSNIVVSRQGKGQNAAKMLKSR
jgi:hypothetical protein